jgi:hypothetical protein
LEENFGVKVEATKEEKEGSENELEGFISSDSREILEEVQSALGKMGWSLDEGI